MSGFMQHLGRKEKCSALLAISSLFFTPISLLLSIMANKAVPVVEHVQGAAKQSRFTLKRHISHGCEVRRK